MIETDKQHWEKVFSTKGEEELSWFQPYPKTSMEFIDSFDLPLEANIIDIGGGDSHFAEALLAKGYQNIYVLDISETAIERAKKRLGHRSSEIHWIVSDITEFIPPIQFDLWHDRAAFHFLTSEDRINKYVSIAAEAISKNGLLVLGTFSGKGPGKCSGLEVRQYSPASMSSKFETAFTRIKCTTEDHTTPTNIIQNFLFCSFRHK